MSMELETINRLYLELSQIATAKTKRELELEAALANISETWVYQRGRVFESMGEDSPRAQAIDAAIENSTHLIAKHGKGTP